MKLPPRLLLCSFWLILFCLPAAYAASCLQPGKWSDPSTWEDGDLPATGDSVNISSNCSPLIFDTPISVRIHELDAKMMIVIVAGQRIAFRWRYCGYK
jgi:hypothetical protein